MSNERTIDLIYMSDKVSISLMFLPFLFGPLFIYLIYRILWFLAETYYKNIAGLFLWQIDPIFWTFPAFLFGLGVTTIVMAKLWAIGVSVSPQKIPAGRTDYSVFHRSAVTGNSRFTQGFIILLFISGIILCLVGVDTYTRFTASTIQVDDWMTVTEQTYQYTQIAKIEHIIEADSEHYVIYFKDEHRTSTMESSDETLLQSYEAAANFAAQQAKLSVVTTYSN